ncbi:hypothetical protein KOM00_01965 [Geomonas sp. Red69]|uniref:hypothetical protein n=1 Tax=Geomonas diazotrophica TaxID=2843197 RepID=UPI001C12117B|nr:hypothetical protein [Geomonas diazotrophica]MBU5635492.1 hypothetical protein [Geomonas diazotrophica]
MATNRKRTPRSRLVPSISPECFNWLCDMQHGPQGPSWKDRFFLMPEEVRQLWLDNKDQVVAWWIKAFPGTRPSMWWRFEAAERPENGESEVEHLKRQGLLTKREQQAIKAKGGSL